SSSSKLKVVEGILNGRRVNYFKGKSAVNALMRDQFQISLKRDPLETKEEAEAILTKLLNFGLFVKVDKTNQKKVLTISQQQHPGYSSFGSESFYIWVYEAHQFRNKMIGFGVLAITFIGVLFPLWPAPMRTGVYYLSMGLCGLMALFFGLAIFRLILWVVLRLFMGQGGWLYPNLFADCGVIESFYPLWGWDEKKAPSVREKEE
ncbi:Translocation protein S62, partial [Clydaea vesicula]